MKRYIDAFLGLLFPQKCIHCGKDVINQLICFDCENKLEFISSYCPICGNPQTDLDQPCEMCNKSDFHFTKARSLYLFNPIIQKIIHLLKYQESIIAARYLADKAAIYLQEANDLPEFDYIIPVPLHKIKKKERGFNQAERIAFYLSQQINVKIQRKFIKRKRFTTTQTKLNRLERQQNVDEAFSLKEGLIDKTANILLIDDVFTTGATMNAISKLLKNRGFTGIYVLTIARA